VAWDQEGEQLLELARDKTVVGRRALVATVGDLFFTRGEVLSDRERALMSEILRQLIHDVEVEVRRALAERFAAEPAAPKELVVALANDEIEVAHPILVHSAVLQDQELVEIIHHRTLEHQLAIAARAEISETVADALVQRGNPDVVTALLQNSGAQLSKQTLAYLVEQSRRVDTFHNPLLRRPELTPDLARRMYWWVSAALRKHIVENFDIEPTAVDERLEETVAALAGPAPREPVSAAELLAEKLATAGQITPVLLVETLRQGEIALFEALFSRLSGIRLRLVRRLLFEPGGEGLAIACRALGVEPSVFTSIFVLSRKARADEQAIAPGEVTRILAFYERVRRPAAERLLHKWQREPEFLRAVWQLDNPGRSHVGS
jgi:uncharacterized protein (DUF2336 family)